MSSCQQCGAQFSWYDRSDKKFCDAKCRKQWSRRGDASKRSLKRIMIDLQTVRQSLKKHPDLAERTNDELKRLREEITDILRLRDCETMIEEAQKAELMSGQQKKRYLSPSEARSLSQK